MTKFSDFDRKSQNFGMLIVRGLFSSVSGPNQNYSVNSAEPKHIVTMPRSPRSPSLSLSRELEHVVRDFSLCLSIFGSFYLAVSFHVFSMLGINFIVIILK